MTATEWRGYTYPVGERYGCQWPVAHGLVGVHFEVDRCGRNGYGDRLPVCWQHADALINAAYNLIDDYGQKLTPYSLTEMLEALNRAQPFGLDLLVTERINRLRTGRYRMDPQLITGHEFNEAVALLLLDRIENPRDFPLHRDLDDAIDRLVEQRGASPSLLADMTPLERTKLINDSGNATTARGMCQSVWREAEVARHNAEKFRYGTRLAEEPTPPKKFDDKAVEDARDRAISLAGSLAHLTEEYVKNGVEFTIDELAEEIIADAELDPDLAEDDVINQGVRDVCRRALKQSPPLTINGTAIPRLITARTEEGKYIRVPVMN